jgi:putative ABC transport system permease protein
MSFNDYANLQFSSARMASSLLVSFSILALIMVAAGLYGLMNYVVAERSRDFAVQMALGATPQRIFTSVVRETIILAAVGIISGVAIAFATRPVLSRIVGEILPTTDWRALASAAVILLLVSIVAALMPAARAVIHSPNEVLRN